MSAALRTVYSMCRRQAGGIDRRFVDCRRDRRTEPFAPRGLSPEALHGREGDGGLGEGVLGGLSGNSPVPQVGRIAETKS